MRTLEAPIGALKSPRSVPQAPELVAECAHDGQSARESVAMAREQGSGELPRRLPQVLHTGPPSGLRARVQSRRSFTLT